VAAPKAPPVLIVDDNVEFASLLGTLFAEQSLVPILAHSATNAITLFKVYNPQAVVIDLLLPDMTGHKLISALKQLGKPKVFVITGVFKGQSQMERVRSLTEVSGWYEKPFDTRLLVEQVMASLGGTAAVKQRAEHIEVEHVTSDFDINILEPVDDGISVGTPDLKDSDVDIDIDIEVPLDESSMAMLETVSKDDELNIELEDITTELQQDGGIELEIPVSSPSPRTRTPSLPRLEPITPPRVAAPRSQSGFSHEGSPTPQQMKAGLRAKMRTGPLRGATVPRLLTAFHLSQETGEIVFEQQGVRKVIFFAEGRPVYARSNQDSDRLGAIAKKEYGLSSAQIQSALEVARRTDRMLGEVLIEHGLVPQTSHHDLLREQTRVIIRSLLTWSEGRYVIGFHVANGVRHAKLEDHPAALVMQGVRELFDLEKLRRLVPDKMRPMPSPSSPFELHELPIPDAAAMLLLRSTGARTVRAMLEEIAPRLSEHDARAHIYSLLMLGVLFSGRATKEVLS
jgi:CheY-like chemotaxis protein